MNINIQKFHALVETVDSGSFTRAAEKLNYTQAGISRMIGDLESEWSLVLLERSKNGVKLTSDGQQLLPSIRKLCLEYNDLIMLVNKLNGLECGLIRIATLNSIATHWLPTIIQNFRKDYPNINFEITPGPKYEDVEKILEEGKADCGLSTNPNLQGFETIPLKHERMLIIMSEDHPFASLDQFPVESLQNESFIILDQATHDMLTNKKIKVNVNFRTHENEMALALTESGIGISIVPEMILERTPYRVVAKELSTPIYRDLVLAYRSNNEYSVAMGHFMKYVLDFIYKISK